MKKSFTAFEYHKDANFYPANYCYEGSAESGWIIYRNNKHYLTLPSGYLLLKTLCCGICSTDIARHKLPFPLPQITGHEVVASYDGTKVVVDINAAHKHLGDKSQCYYCENDLQNHCPDRLTLGIDRLPGGFAPYILVPANAIYPLPENFSVKLASIIEPFAAALHAVKSENIQAGDTIAIIGPRRLGSLLILALNLWREKYKINVKISALTRNDNVQHLCELAGADEVVHIDNLGTSTYDVVFDTSGSTSGFELALSIANRVVHVKSTNGQQACGLKYLTEMVIDELSLLPMKKVSVSQKLSPYFPKELEKIIMKKTGATAVVDRNVDKLTIGRLEKYFPNLKILDQKELEDGKEYLVRKFDIAIGSSLEFINSVTRNKMSQAAIKPKGLLVLITDDKTQIVPGHATHEPVNESVSHAMGRGVKINTSRCGDFLSAIDFFGAASFTKNNKLENKGKRIESFLDYFVSATYNDDSFLDAFERAKNDREAVKVLVEF